MFVYLSQSAAISPLGASYQEVLNSLQSGKNCLSPVPKDVVPAGFPLKFIGLMPNQKLDVFYKDENSFVNLKRQWIENLFSDIDLEKTKIDRIIFTHNDFAMTYEYCKNNNVDFYDNPKFSICSQDFLDYIYKFKSADKPITAIHMHNTCSSSVAAIILARNYITAGIAESCLIIPYEVSNHFFQIFINLGSLGALNTKAETIETASIPFSDMRAGFVKADAIGYMLVQNEKEAYRLEKTPLAKVVGGATSSDCHSLTDGIEDGSNVEKTVRAALNEAKMKFEEIDYINAHGSGTLLNDQIELVGLSRLIKNMDKKIYMSSTKSQFGHALCATGAVEIDAILKMFKHKFLAANINYNSKKLNEGIIIPAKPIHNYTIKYALKNAFGFGGYNASIIIENLVL